MKRAEKITLLTKLLQGQMNRQPSRLEQAIANGPRFLVMLYDLDDTSQSLTNTTPVHFHDRGQDYRMSWKEAQVYAEHTAIQTLAILPDNYRRHETSTETH